MASTLLSRVLLLSLLNTAFLRAGDTLPSRPESAESMDQMEVTYVGPSKFTGSADAGKITTLSAKYRLGDYKWQLSRELTLRLKTAVEAFWFDIENAAGRIPDRFANVGIGIGGDYRLNQQYQLKAEFIPTLSFGEESVDWDDVSFSALLAVGRRFSDQLTGVAGVMVQPQFEFPVVPIVGAIWKISDSWKLNATFPRASIVYAPSERWELLGLLQAKGGKYRTPEDFGKGSGRDDLGNDWLSYIDVEVGVGANYQVCKGFKAGLQAGVSVYRRFDFDSADFDLHGRPAPYVGATMSLSY